MKHYGYLGMWSVIGVIVCAGLLLILANVNTKTNSNNESSTSTSSTTTSSQCHLDNSQSLPDPKCTPGAINQNVTQKNIKSTICLSGFTKTVRPPTSYTGPLKIKLLKSYGLVDTKPKSSYELDHLIPLEIGGNPKSVKNLWPEPGFGNYTFHMKDQFENYLHKQICSGKMPLIRGQQEMATNWVFYFQFNKVITKK